MKCRLILVGLLTLSSIAYSQVYEISSGTIRFHSDAPQELIRASSSQLRGIIDLNKKTFLFKIGIGSFMGFNSPLQEEHFNENYMETSLFPEAAYFGKIIEDVDLTKDGTYTIRAKGKLRIHGVEQERIIRSVLVIKSQKITVQSDFVVLLADHNIKIPRIVNDKLAPEIKVSVNASLLPRN